MIRGLYAAASSLDAASQQQEVAAYNLSNTSTPGYRQRGVSFETFDRVLGRTARETGDVTGTRVAAVYHDFRPGAVQQTGQPFDLALGDQDRFFVLAGPNGPVYTRNGTFHINGQNQIVSEGGYPLQGVAGRITLPNGAANVTVDATGNVLSNGVQVGTIQLVRFNNPKRLTAVGPTLYRADAEAGIQNTDGRVLQGYREASNVQPADAMVRMMALSRYFDAAQRALRTISESVQLNTRPQSG